MIVAILFYVGISAIFILVSVITYVLAKKNSRVYICDSCGEVSKFEQMEAKSCSVCGGKLIDIKRKNIDIYKEQNHLP